MWILKYLLISKVPLRYYVSPVSWSLWLMLLLPLPLTKRYFQSNRCIWTLEQTVLDWNCYIQNYTTQCQWFHSMNHRRYSTKPIQRIPVKYKHFNETMNNKACKRSRVSVLIRNVFLLYLHRTFLDRRCSFQHRKWFHCQCLEWISYDLSDCTDFCNV